MEYFKRGSYQTKIISEEYFNKWLELNPQFKEKIDYQKFKRYWRYLRKEMFNTILTNSSGLDLPFLLGNISIKIIDVEFNGPEDYLRTPRIEKETVIVQRSKPIGSIRKPCIVWKKNRNFKDIPSMLGFERAQTLRKEVSTYIKKNGMNSFQKLSNHLGTPSKVRIKAALKEGTKIKDIMGKEDKKEEKKFSIFDLIDKNDY